MNLNLTVIIFLDNKLLPKHFIFGKMKARIIPQFMKVAMQIFIKMLVSVKNL